MFLLVPRQGTKVPTSRALWCPGEELYGSTRMVIWKYPRWDFARNKHSLRFLPHTSQKRCNLLIHC